MYVLDHCCQVVVCALVKHDSHIVCSELTMYYCNTPSATKVSVKTELTNKKINYSLLRSVAYFLFMFVSTGNEQ